MNINVLLISQDAMTCSFQCSTYRELAERTTEEILRRNHYIREGGPFTRKIIRIFYSATLQWSAEGEEPISNELEPQQISALLSNGTIDSRDRSAAAMEKARLNSMIAAAKAKAEANAAEEKAKS